MTQPSTTPPTKARRDEAGGFARKVGGFTAATTVSRILGYARDAGIVHVFGGGALTDSFYAAFRIANFFRRTLGEGALTSSFVPILTRELSRDPAEGRRFMTSLWWTVACLAAGLTVAGILFSRPLVWALTYGFTRDPAQFERTVLLTRILFPHLLFVTLAAIAQGALNVRGRFFVPALAPVMFSIAILTYLGLLKGGLLPPTSVDAQLAGLAVAASLGGLLELLVLAPPLGDTGLGWSRGGPRWHPELKAVAALMAPSMIGMAADHVGTFVNTVAASFLEEGSMTAIYNSSRLMQLPLALFGVATAAVALPHLSDHASRRDMEAYRRTVATSLKLMAFLLWPSTVGLAVISLPLVRLLFEHGRFTFEASLMTSSALVWYSLGIAAYAATKVFVTGFYALEDAKTPVKLGMATVAVNVLLVLALMAPMRVSGLALASSVSAWAGCVLLGVALHRRAAFFDWRSLGLPVLKSLAASLLMGAGCWALQLALPDRPWLEVAASIAFAVPVYFGLAVAFGLEERHMVAHLLTSHKAQSAAASAE